MEKYIFCCRKCAEEYQKKERGGPYRLHIEQSMESGESYSVKTAV